MTISLKESKSFPAGFRVQSRKRTSNGKIKASTEMDVDNHDIANANDLVPVSDEAAIPNESSSSKRSGRKSLNRDSSIEKPKSTKKKQKHGEDEPDKNDWICGICHSFESGDGTELVLCDGPCMRSFHLGCLGLTWAEIHSGGEKWLCQDCILGQHNCFICGVRGLDNKVWKPFCNSGHC